MKKEESGYTKIEMSCKWPDDPESKTTYEIECPDANISDMLQGVYTCLIGMTWLPETILKGMDEFLAEKGYYDNDEKDV